MYLVQYAFDSFPFSRSIQNSKTLGGTTPNRSVDRSKMANVSPNLFILSIVLHHQCGLSSFFKHCWVPHIWKFHLCVEPKLENSVLCGSYTQMQGCFLEAILKKWNCQCCLSSFLKHGWPKSSAAFWKPFFQNEIANVVCHLTFFEHGWAPPHLKVPSLCSAKAEKEQCSVWIMHERVCSALS